VGKLFGSLLSTLNSLSHPVREWLGHRYYSKLLSLLDVTFSSLNILAWGLNALIFRLPQRLRFWVWIRLFLLLPRKTPCRVLCHTQDDEFDEECMMKQADILSSYTLL
jgi:hypothetical protein